MKSTAGDFESVCSMCVCVCFFVCVRYVARRMTHQDIRAQKVYKIAFLPKNGTLDDFYTMFTKAHMFASSRFSSIRRRFVPIIVVKKTPHSLLRRCHKRRRAVVRRAWIRGSRRYNVHRRVLVTVRVRIRSLDSLLRRRRGRLRILLVIRESIQRDHYSAPASIVAMFTQPNTCNLKCLRRSRHVTD